MQVNQTYPSITGGLSTQPLHLRRPNQCTLLDNFVVDPIRQLVRRNGLERKFDIPIANKKFEILELQAGFTSVLSWENTLSMSTSSGEVSIERVNGAGTYVDGQQNLKFLSLGGYVLVLNTGRTTKFKPVPVKSKYVVYTGMYVVRQTAKGVSYNVEYGGHSGSYTSGDTAIQPGDVVAGLFSAKTWTKDINGTPVKFKATKLGNVIVVIGTASDSALHGKVPKQITGSSSIETAVDVINDEINSLSKLPPVGVNGAYLKVSGLDYNVLDDSYFEFKASSKGDDASEGKWKEVAKFGEFSELDPASMPHVMATGEDGKVYISPADGNKTKYTHQGKNKYIQFPEWGVRNSGNIKSSPYPNFIGYPITSIALVQNRLHYTTHGGGAFSKVDSYLDMFNTTATAVLDGDPIHYDVPFTSVSDNLYSQVQVGSNIYVAGTANVFRIQGTQNLSPKTFSIETAIRADTVPVHTPTSDTSAFYSSYNGTTSDVRELYLTAETGTPDMESITTHMSSAVLGKVTHMDSSPNHGILVVKTDAFSNKVFVLKWVNNNRQKVLAAWCTWSLSVESIEYFKILGNKVWVVYKDKSAGANSLAVGYINLEYVEGAVHLDDMVTLSSQTIPSRYTSSVTAVRDKVGHTKDERLSIKSGKIVQPVTVNNKSTVGYLYSSEYQPSMPVVRDRQDRVDMSVRLQVLTLSVFLENSVQMKSVVQIKDRLYNSTYIGRTVGESKTDELPNFTDVFTVPVRGRNTESTLTIKTDSYLPMNITGLEHISSYTRRGQRIT